MVSALHDGETVTKEAAEHIGGCPTCKERLREYAELGAELRLLASAAPEVVPTPLRLLPAPGGRWARRITARVLVPRFALGLGIVAIVGLSVGLGLMRAQGSGLWFQFDVTDPAAHGSAGGLLQAGGHAAGHFRSADSHEEIVYRMKALEIQSDFVRLEVTARAFVPETPGEGAHQGAMAAGAPPFSPNTNQILANVPAREIKYVPGKSLEIPLDGGGKILLTGQVFRRPPSLGMWALPLTPKPDEIVLSMPALVRGSEFLGTDRDSARAEGENPAIGICLPSRVAFVFALNPFEGAVQGEAEFGQAHFKMDGQDYTLFSATPISGGDQPREIWVYRAANCPPSFRPADKTASTIWSGGVSWVLGHLRN